MSVKRHSSRLRPEGLRGFLPERLKGAVSYDRIAGYFRSSILELIGEELEDVPAVRVICNSELDPRDQRVATMAHEVIEQRLLGIWRDVDPAEALLEGPARYRCLYELLTSGRLQVRVVPKGKVFVHGKAGVITYADGTSTSFVGSANETRAAFSENYEIVWEDSSHEAVAWVKAEFEALWNDPDAVDLPNVVIQEVNRLASRVEVAVQDLDGPEVPPAFLTESPLHEAGNLLRPWQRSFVDTFMKHRDAYGKARLLIADEVGLGKTLSMATSAIAANLLGDGPVLILAPATLTLQWQTELIDKLGVPSVVWHSTKKGWVTPDGAFIPSSADDVIKAPMQIAIFSTGLVVRSDSVERAALLTGRYGMVILDEAHKARGSLGAGSRRRPNNLLQFMMEVAERSRHVILGTATPMQLHADEVWDLMAILASGAEHVLGDAFSRWQRGDERTELLQHARQGVLDASQAWEYLRNPLPLKIDWPEEDRIGVNLYESIRFDLGMPAAQFVTSATMDKLTMSELDFHEAARKDRNFFRRHNPVIRNTVLRRRKDLEDAGLLPKVGVHVHPDTAGAAATYAAIRATFTDGRALHTPPTYKAAYRDVEEFLDAYTRRKPSARLLRPLLLQRVCSSVEAGISTLSKLLIDATPDADLAEDPDGYPVLDDVPASATMREKELLEAALKSLQASRTAGDPKYLAVRDTLLRLRTDGQTWLEHGCIVFSQYYDTARWIAKSLAEELPEQRIGLYAGAGKSRAYLAGQSAEVSREQIKRAVRDRDINIVIATDAAAEGLNLQTLGTLINVDLPWNPARLEQRVGRIRRIGQARRSVDVMNLVYTDTQDERIYAALSQRMSDAYDIFGKLPDVLEDDWITDVQDTLDKMEKYLYLEADREDVFGERYKRTLVDDGEDTWATWSRVVSKSDLYKALTRPWGRRN